MILLSVFDFMAIAAAALSSLFAAGIAWRYYAVRRFRSKCIKQAIDPSDPLCGYFYINEEKYHFVLIDRVGELLHICYHDEDGEATRRVHVDEVYPTW